MSRVNIMIDHFQHRRLRWIIVLLFLCLKVHFFQFAICQEEEITGPCTVIFEDPLKGLDIHSSDFTSIQGSILLGNSNVFLQDSKGFIWLLWQGSLYRFDGYRLTGFEKIPARMQDLKANNVQDMAEDELGYIWIGCRKKEGLYRYDPWKEIFERFPRDEKDPQEISDVSIWSVSADMQGSVWIATADYNGGRGLYRYQISSDSFEEFREDPKDPASPLSLPSNDVHYVYADSTTGLWLGVNRYKINQRPDGLYHYDLEDRLFRRVLLEWPAGNTTALDVPIRKDGKGNLWISGDQLIMIPRPWSKHISRISDTTLIIEKFIAYPDLGNVFAFDIDSQDRLWLLERKGEVINLDTRSGIQKRYKLADLSQVEYPWFFKVLCDNAGSVWCGYSIGISRYVPGKRKFTVQNHPVYSESTGKQEAIYSVYVADNGILWVGMRNVLLRIMPGTQESREYIPFDLHEAPTSALRNRGNPLKIIEGGPEGDLWVGGDNHLFIFHTGEERFKRITYPNTWYNLGGWIESRILIQDRIGQIWIGTDLGSICIDLQQQTAFFKHGFMDKDYLAGGSTNDIVEDNRGMLWLGTNLGLTRYDPLLDTGMAIGFNPRLQHGLPEPDISAILKDREGNLWFGHPSGGISYLDASQVEDPDLQSDSPEFSYLSEEDGMPDIYIHDLVEDLSGNIWIASRSGISCYDPGTHQFKVYTEIDGIDIMPFTSKFFLNEKTGKIYIGGAKGLLSFHPDSIPVNTHVPSVVFTGFRLNNESVAISDSSVLYQSIIYTEMLDLSHDQNFLEFTFAALDYTDPSKNQYKYFMQGVDPDTVYSGTDRTAEYRDMKPGRYTFWVTGSNNDGIWNPGGTCIDIHIRPPWYRSSLANGSYILLGFLIIAGVIWWRTSRLQKEKLLLEAQVAGRTKELRQKNEQILEMEQLKTRFFTDVSHEIRTPLTLISGPLENLILKDFSDDETRRWLHVIKRNSNRLLSLVNQLLDISRLDAGQMKLILTHGDVIKHVGILVQEYQSLAESRHIRFLSEVPEEELVTWCDREKMEKVMTNLLSNAFKYTPDHGTITIRVKIRHSKHGIPHPLVRIMVADTGPGIPESERDKIFERFYRSQEEQHESTGGTGIGLSLTKELISLMKGDIYVRSGVGEGAFFIATIPVGKEHLESSEYVVKEEVNAQPSEPVRDNAEDQVAISGTERAMEYELLVVEDNVELRTYIRENLADLYRIVEAGNGTRGVEKAQSRVPDLVISDIMMPGMDGMELCDRLKTDERTSHVPVILLTAKFSREDKIEGLELGADDYISKPFDMKELKVRIKNLLAQREKLKHKYTEMIWLDWEQVLVTTLEEKFLKRITSVISKRMHDSEFNVDKLQEEMAMSRVNLFRKLKALTGDTPSGLIRTFRLQTAAAMLKKGNENITHIALETGFSNSSIFAQLFKKEYGMSPGEYRKKYSLK